MDPLYARSARIDLSHPKVSFSSAENETTFFNKYELKHSRGNRHSFLSCVPRLARTARNSKKTTSAVCRRRYFRDFVCLFFVVDFANFSRTSRCVSFLFFFFFSLFFLFPEEDGERRTITQTYAAWLVRAESRLVPDDRPA